MDRNSLEDEKRTQAESRAFTGAWIETTDATPPASTSWSRLHGRVDRNFGVWRYLEPELRSRLHGRVDRNFMGDEFADTKPGRAFTGAWIETEVLRLERRLEPRRAFTGAWIETDCRLQG